MRPTIVHMAVLIQCVIYVPTFGENRNALPLSVASSSYDKSA